jgi:hypothetical protein
VGLRSSKASRPCLPPIDDKQPWHDFIRDAVRRLASGVRT